jgi:hypothetical protein
LFSLGWAASSRRFSKAAAVSAEAARLGSRVKMRAIQSAQPTSTSPLSSAVTSHTVVGNCSVCTHASPLHTRTLQSCQRSFERCKCKEQRLSAQATTTENANNTSITSPPLRSSSEPGTPETA